MSRDATPSPASLEIVRRLVAREAPGERDPKLAGAVLQGTLMRVSNLLRDSMGEDGRNALLVRALARTEADHPALKNIVRLDQGGIQVDGLAASVEAHGIAPVTAAVEAVLAAIIDVLARLIGEDMAIRLIDNDGPKSQRGGGAQSP